jgi:hypothetical protein
MERYGRTAKQSISAAGRGIPRRDGFDVALAFQLDLSLGYYYGNLGAGQGGELEYANESIQAAVRG